MVDNLEPEYEDLAWTDEVYDEEEYPFITQGDGDYDNYGWLSTEVYGDLYDPYAEDGDDHYPGDGDVE